MRSLVPTLAVLGIAACDPEGPGASGDLTLAGADTSGYATLELRFFPDLDGGFDLGGPPEIPNTSSDFVIRDSHELTGVMFPFAYSIGMGVGMTHTEVWRVAVWLATDATKLWPNGSEPFATAAVTIEPCGGVGADGYCGSVEGVDLQLSPPGT
jgi:hypothetical protein